MDSKNKAIRKSAFMTYKQCPKRFEYYYFHDPKYWEYGSTNDKSNMKTWRGNEFHEGAEHFFDRLSSGSPEYTDGGFRAGLPQHEDQIVNEWFDWFAGIEEHRYFELKKKGESQYFTPVANELKVYYKNTIDKTGHIDRIDQIGEKELCIVEYKAGESYDMEKPDRLTSMNAEIGFYVQILKQMEEYKDFKITRWKVINPVHRKVWTNKISPISLRTVEKTLGEMTEKILKKGNFPKKITPLCNYCPYMEHCDPYYDQQVNIDFSKPL